MRIGSSLMGDPDALGWGTTIAYMLAAVAAYAAARGVGAGEDRGAERKRMLWLALCAMLIGLGVNKQLDLQSMLTDTIRRMARDGGWYDRRRQAQAWFVGVMTALMLAFSIASVIYVRRMRRWERLGAFGMMMLLGFVALRIATFHHAALQVDAWIAHLIELAGIGLISGAALASCRSPAPATIS